MSISRSLTSNQQIGLSKSYQASCRQRGGRETRKKQNKTKQKSKKAKFQSLELFCLEFSLVLDDRSYLGFFGKARSEQ